MWDSSEGSVILEGVSVDKIVPRPLVHEYRRSLGLSVGTARLVPHWSRRFSKHARPPDPGKIGLREGGGGAVS